MNWFNRPSLLFYSVLFMTGILFFLLYNEFLIIKFSLRPHANQSEQELVTKKTVTFSFWKEHRCQTEDSQVLWYTNQDQRILQITSRWLELFGEMQEDQNKISVQSVSLNKTEKEAYVSFDRTPFFENNSTYQKLLCIEGLLKTLKNAKITPQKIFFLVNHQPINDAHLDFSHGWPLQGFITP